LEGKMAVERTLRLAITSIYNLKLETLFYINKKIMVRGLGQSPEKHDQKFPPIKLVP
jgi:hypothetical protein